MRSLHHSLPTKMGQQRGDGDHCLRWLGACSWKHHYLKIFGCMLSCVQFTLETDAIIKGLRKPHMKHSLGINQI